jgi:hypothetical protein
MSTNRRRSKLRSAECSRDYHLISLNEWYPLYWDEGYNFYPRWRRGYKNPTKTIPIFKVREYRTWKYNRKTQWKTVY